jgi:hypothetical protein
MRKKNEFRVFSYEQSSFVTATMCNDDDFFYSLWLWLLIFSHFRKKQVVLASKLESDDAIHGVFFGV